MSVDILERLSQQDVRIWLDEEGELRYSVPRSWMTEERRCWLREHKLGILKALQSRPANDYQPDAASTSAAPAADLIHWRDCTTEQLQNVWTRVKAGAPVRIYSGTLGESVWWVHDDEIASALKQQGITEVCYTAAELRALAGKPPEFLKDVHQFKRSFGATLAKATAEEPEPADTTPGSDTANPSAGQVACGDCAHFEPDTQGDGTGIGRCTAGVVLRPQIDPPLYPKALRRCNHFSSKEATPC